MNQLLAKQILPRVGFFCKPITHHDYFFGNAMIPDFQVRKSISGIEIDLNLDELDSASDVGSSLRPNVSVRSINIPNFIHNFTFGHLADATDRAFSSIFDVVNDGFDDLTPDVIVRTPSGSFHVVEFTTFRGRQEEARHATQNKITKYELACRNRSLQGPVSLHTIGVHRGGLWTNMRMDQRDIDELCFRFRLALAIESEIKILCPELRDMDEEYTKIEREILGIVSGIQVNWSRTEEKFPSFKRDLFWNFYHSEPDSGYLQDVLDKVTRGSQKSLLSSSFIDPLLTLEERLSKNLSECTSVIDQFISTHESRDNLRPINWRKGTVLFPPWIFREAHPGKSLHTLQELNVEGDHPMCRIWERVRLSAQLEEIERMNDDPMSELEYALSGTRVRDDERSKYHRVRVDLDVEEKEFIAILGVNGKAFKDLTSVKDHREKSKLIFSIFHDTTPVEEFLYTDSSPDFKPSNDLLYSPYLEDYELRLQAQKIHQPTISRRGGNEFLQCHKGILTSPLGSWTQFVNVVGSELSASVKQHVKPSSFVVKRLLNSPVYLLIKPTSSKGHIFVSFAVEKNYYVKDLEGSSCFRTYYDAGDLFVTDFVSFKLSKLTNLCKTSALYESALCFWNECYGRKVWMSHLPLGSGSNSSKDIQYMVKLSLLTLMEDKATTEELQTLSRYIVMEGFVSQPEIPKPHKMVGKLPTKLRSELQVFLINRLFSAMKRISQSPFVLKRNENSLSWSGLFNPLSGRDTSEVHPIINACYNGYFKNKEEETEPSALSAMYKKIIELEHLRPISDRYLGWDDPVEPKMHEFSRSYLKEVCNHGKVLLQKLYGKNVLDQIDQDIRRELGSLTLERLATLKATSNFDDDWYIFKDVKDKNYTRDKVLVKMTEYAKRGKTLAVEMFEECMTNIENRGCMHICLFKKQQHGGLREIYVMGAEERIVQSVVESIAKCVGRFFPSDTLCNPNNKTKIPESHGIRARKHCKGSVWTTATSDDARKWNQGHFVTKFALMLCEFTHSMWWPIIIRGCSMFTKKRMMMNLEFLRIIDSKRELELEDDFIMTLYNAYHGNVKVPWLEPGKTYLETSTGMMQGILHFTSSLLHSLHQEYVRSLSFKLFNSKVHPEMSLSIVCDMMQGSDDSSMLISFPSSSEELIVKCKVTAALCFRVKRALGVYLGIYPSEKSTSNTDFTMEYNSEFYFHNQHVRPTIRWIAASNNLSEAETLVARQEEASNLVTPVCEGGGSFSLTAMIQQSQCTTHYALMGMGVSSLFSEYKKAIMKWCDPGLGFFLLDNPRAAGLGGFRYNLYKAITRTNLSKIYSFFMKKVRMGSDGLLHNEIPETCSVSPGGALILSSSLRWGSRKKFQKLRSRLGIPDDWIDQINKIPHILYRAPRTGEEILLRIAEKVHSPGVVSSLSTGNAVAKVMASSVYFLSATIFEDSGRPEFSFIENSKYSLLYKLATYEGYSDFGEIDPEDILFLFPNLEEFHSLDQLVFDRGEIEVIMRSSMREATQTRVTVFDHSVNDKCSPEKLVSDKWFGTQKCRIGRTGMMREWERLKLTIRWLRDSPEETLETSPLHNHIQIRNFFARMEGKARTIRITGAPVKKRSGLSKLSMVIRDNFTKVGILSGIEDDLAITRSVSVEICKHTLFSILNGPYSEETKARFCQKSLEVLPQVVINQSDRKTRSNIVGLLQEYCRDKEGIIRKLETLGAGTIGAYIRPQKSKKVGSRVQYFGEGVWRGIMDGYGVQISVDCKEGQIPQITGVWVSRCREVWILSKSIRSWCDDMGVRNDNNIAPDQHQPVNGWIFNFQIYGSGHRYGAPIYILKEEMDNIHDIQDHEIGLKVTNNTLRLYVNLPKVKRDLHILTYTPSDNDISSSSVMELSALEIFRMIPEFNKQPSKSWLLCDSLPIKFLKPVLDISEGHRQVGGIRPDLLKSLIKNCTESSIRSKVGTIFSMLPTDQPQALEIDTSEMIDLILAEMDDISFDSAVECVSECLDLNSVLYDEDFGQIDMGLFGPAHHKEISSLMTISHPLMDGLVDSALSQMGRNGIRRLIETGKCCRRDLGICELLYRAMGRDPNSIKVDIVLADIMETVSDDELG
ncbi:polymerase [Odrenisrou virus]|uniref:RNA-directed RNA polymerase L n=1 Tax=Odrenisrou virus TaxID=1048855 RepID=I1T353_9VIRU|nr:polymerase [Odrenisrou virus]AEL29670.1 polymerase [Odrenisrou virus]